MRTVPGYGEMREESKQHTIFQRFELDDGWNLPVEIVEEIEVRAVNSLKEAYRQVCQEHDDHKGDWLTREVAERYEAGSWIYRVVTGGQYVGPVRRLGQELQTLYGVSETEAVNILNGLHIDDYVERYQRMKHRIPKAVNLNEIYKEVISEHKKVAL